MIIRSRIFLSLSLSLAAITGVAQAPIQDTLKADLFHAEKMFLDSNLQLLAQRYNIDAN